MENPIKRGRGVNKKAPGGTRRVWTNREEAVFIAALKDLVSNGWKSDNGFRTGYLVKLEEALKQAIPGCDLVINPNIISKITSWRKHYGSLVTAQRDFTGVGFNTTTNTLEVTDEQWALIVQKDSTMKGMRYREWPMWLDWVEVFGKDRATGEIMEDVTDAATFMKTQYGQPSGTEGVADNGDDEYNYVNVEGDDTPMPSHPPPGTPMENSTAGDKDRRAPSTNTSKKKKNKAESSEPSMAVVLENFCRATNEFRETIASKIGYEKDLGQKRTQIYGLLGSVPGLSMSDKLDATELIGARNDRVEIFMGMTEEARASFALRLLERENGASGSVPK